MVGGGEGGGVGLVGERDGVEGEGGGTADAVQRRRYAAARRGEALEAGVVGVSGPAE